MSETNAIDELDEPGPRRWPVRGVVILTVISLAAMALLTLKGAHGDWDEVGVPLAGPVS